MTSTPKQYHGISWGAGALGRHSREDKSVLERVRKARANLAAAGEPIDGGTIVKIVQITEQVA